MPEHDFLGNMDNIVQAIERGTLDRVSAVTVSVADWQALSATQRERFEAWCAQRGIQLGQDKTLQAGLTKITRHAAPPTELPGEHGH
jgi:hypothetical protein